MQSSGPNRGATVAVELTPPGRAAVAVVLVAGPDATRVVGGLFAPTSGRELAEVPLERIALGRWNAPRGEELVVCRRSPERIEIHCHGGFAAVRAVVEALVERGCCEISWRDWLRAGGGDPIRTAAQIALADAPTERTASILLDQYHGALAAAIGPAIAAATAENWSSAAKALDALLMYGHVGTHLTQPWRVVLAGRPNVGKSSLINALVGFERAIVSRQRGTTRDVVTTVTAIDGWPVQLADTAGLCAAENELESAGVQLAMETLQRADLVVAVDEATESIGQSTDERDQLSRWIADLPHTLPVIHVRNKIDLIKTADEGGASVISTSALTGAGIEKLIETIGGTLVPSAPPPGSAVPFAADQITALEMARAAVEVRDAGGVAAALQPLLATAQRGASLACTEFRTVGKAS